MVSDPIKILMVDDNEQVLIEHEHLLVSEGYRTTTTRCGREAIAFTDQMQLEILLVDEDLTHPNCVALVAEPQRRQPRVFFPANALPQESQNPSTIHKWEHAEVKTTIRNVLAA